MFKKFNTSKLAVLPVSCRDSDLDLSIIKDLSVIKKLETGYNDFPEINIVAKKIKKAKDLKASVILMMGAHVIRAGMQRYIIDLMEKGYISCIAVNGACAIHDFEFALIGKTTESVARYIKNGQFGLWKETSVINDIINLAAKKDIGAGEAVGEAILNKDYPNKDISIFAAGYRLKIPVTVHVGIGYDILYEHPNCSGGAWGQTSYTDFLIFTQILNNLENGVVMNFGSAVMAPEVYLKALAMVRNIAKQEDRQIANFTTLVCDLRPLPKNYSTEAKKSSADYYFRPWKTMLVRTVADGGTSYYVKGSHDKTIAFLWNALL